MKKLALRAGGVVMVFVTLFTLWACLKNMAMMQASNSWTKTTGTITSSVMEEVSIGRKEKFQAQIRYVYDAGGRPQNGSRIRFADATGSARTAQQPFLDKYPAGAKVDVYYDPNDPAQSVLEPGGGLRRFGLLLPPLIVGGIAAGLLVAGFKRS